MRLVKKVWESYAGLLVLLALISGLLLIFKLSALVSYPWWPLTPIALGTWWFGCLFAFKRTKENFFESLSQGWCICQVFGLLYFIYLPYPYRQVVFFGLAIFGIVVVGYTVRLRNRQNTLSGQIS